MIGNGGGSGDPFQKLENHIRKNPLGADRKRTDLKELYTQNQVSCSHKIWLVCVYVSLPYYFANLYFCLILILKRTLD